MSERLNKVKTIPQRGCSIGEWAATICLLIAAIQPGARAQTYVLSDGNARVTLNPSNAAITQSLTIDGGPNLVGQAGYWSDIGGTIAPLASAVTPGWGFMSQQVSPNHAWFGILGLFLNLGVDYEVSGGVAGSGEATILETIYVANRFYGPDRYSLYSFNNFGLTGLNRATMGADSSLLQRGDEGSELLVNTTRVPTHYEIGDTGALLGKLTAGTRALALSDTPPIGVASPGTPGNVAYALQWDLWLGPVSQTSFVTTTHISLLGIPPAVPEPNSLMLLVLGAAPSAALFRKKRM